MSVAITIMMNMNFQDIIKFQMMSHVGHSITGSSTGIHTSSNSMGSKMSLYDMIFQFVFMFLIGIVDDMCKAAPTFMKNVQEKLGGFMNTRVKCAIDSVTSSLDDQLSNSSVMLDKRHPTNSITMMRIYMHESNANQNTHLPKESTDPTEMNIMVDAILSRVAGLDNIPTLRLNPNGKFLVSYKEKPIQITNEIFMRIDNIATDNKTGHVNSIKITLLSNTLSASEISKFIQTVYGAYQEELKNSLGKNIYFFDHKVRDMGPPPMPVGQGVEKVMNHKRMMIQTAPKMLSFTMTPFYSNKKFSNIFGTEVRKIQQRVEFFANNKSWYDEKGIPYQLGILLSGLPGTGKTSIIRAIANMTKRHIVNVNFGSITTASQLKNLFYNDKLVVYNDNSMSDTKSYFIPIDQRLYVLEEIDTVGDVIKQRRMDVNAPKVDVVPDELTLGEILTVLDGTMEIPGRMIIMTSNHPELLDRALLRPGRIDVKASFGNAPRDLIVEMFTAYVEGIFPKNRIPELPHNLLTPAEVGEVLMKFCKAEYDINEIIDQLVAYAKEKCPSEFMSPSPSSTQTDMNVSTPKDDQMGAPMCQGGVMVGAPTLKHEHNTQINVDAPTFVRPEEPSIDIPSVMPKCWGYVACNKSMIVKNSNDIKDIKGLLQTLHELEYKDEYIIKTLVLYCTTNSILITLREMIKQHKKEKEKEDGKKDSKHLPGFTQLIESLPNYKDNKIDNLPSLFWNMAECYGAANISETLDDACCKIINNQLQMKIEKDVIVNDCKRMYDITSMLTNNGTNTTILHFPKTMSHVCKTVIDDIQSRAKTSNIGFPWFSEEDARFVMQSLIKLKSHSGSDDNAIHKEVSKVNNLTSIGMSLSQCASSMMLRSKNIDVDIGTGTGNDNFFADGFLCGSSVGYDGIGSSSFTCLAS